MEQEQSNGRNECTHLVDERARGAPVHDEGEECNAGHHEEELLPNHVPLLLHDERQGEAHRAAKPTPRRDESSAPRRWVLVDDEAIAARVTQSRRDAARASERGRGEEGGGRGVSACAERLCAER